MGLDGQILKQLHCVKEAICKLNATIGGSGSATEATLTALLAAVQQHQDYEFLLVRDPGAADLIVRQVIEYDETTDTFTYSYQTIAGVPYVPIGVPVYVDDSALLNLMLTQLTAINADLDVALSTRASEATVAAINTKLAPAVRTHNTVVSSGVGTVPAGSLRGSVLNSGGAAGVWNGIAIPAGVSIPWGDIFSRDTYGAIAFDGSGTVLTIEYTT